MRIYFINRFFYPDHSATSQLLSDLTFHLAEREHDIHVITSRQRYDEPGAGLRSRETICGVEVRRLWTSGFGRKNLFGRAVDYSTFYLAVFWHLTISLSKGDIVVAKTDPPMISVVAAITANLRGAALINWCQDLFPEVAAALGVWASGGTIDATLKTLRNRSLRSAAVNVVLGSRMAEHLSGEGIEKHRIKIIHNWADGTGIHPIPRDTNPLRQAWGLDDRFIVGYSGNIGRAHEFTTILETASALRERKDIVFLFIGAGARRDWLEQQVSTRELDNIVFKPYQLKQNLDQSLSVPDLHLISLEPALEGLIVPSKFYGIAAAGRPTLFIGDPDGEIAQILREHLCGYSAAVGDAEAARRIIESLVSDPERCQELGKNARSTFERHFDRSIALGSWLNTVEACRPKQLAG